MSRFRSIVFKLACLLAGIALLLVVLSTVDLNELLEQVRHVGVAGILAVLLVYAVGFLFDTVSWHLMLPSAPLTLRWQARLFCVRSLGEAVNITTPLGGFGGEPVKAIVLNKRLGVGYAEGAASLLMAKTTNLLALLLFLSLGCVFVVRDTRIPAGYQSVALVGFAALVVGVGLFFIIQRQGWSSVFGHWLSGRRFGAKLVPLLQGIQRFDARLRGFYVGERLRFLWAFTLAFATWIAGVIELLIVFHLLSVPVDWRDAVVIEATAQLVRAGTFYVPASIGAQEGAFVVTTSLLTGNPTAGLTAALIRRARELLWVVIGFMLGSLLSSTDQPCGERP